MKAKDLKNSILQLAIQGKLVPQDPNDEPASKLLEKIRAAKQKLIKEGKIKKDKQESVIYKGDDNNYYEKIGTEVRNITDEIPFEIPDSWEWVRVSDISSKISAGGDKPQCFSKIRTEACQIPVLSNGEKNEGIFGYTNKATITAPSITVSGRGTIGFSCVRWEPYFPIVRLITITPFRGINLNFLQCTMSALLEQGVGTSIKQLTVPMIAPKLIPLPPTREQERIVSRITTLDPLVEDYDKAENELTALNETFPEQIKKSILQYAIQGKLVPQDPNDESASVLLDKIKAEKQKLIKAGKIKKDKVESYIYKRDNRHYEKIGDKEVDITDEIPFQIPNSWEIVRLNDIGIYRKGPFGSSLTKSMFVPRGKDAVKVYEQKNAIQKDCNIGEYYISRKYYEEKMKGFVVHPGDILVSCAGTIGETYVLPENIEEGIINQALMRMQIFAPINLKYFLLYFDYVLKRSAKSHSKGSAIKNIPPFEIFKRLPLPLPPLSEQKRIVARVEKLLNLLPLG